MPTARAPEPPPLPKPPICPLCGTIMQLEGSAPATHYDNLDQFKYVCDCGETSETTVAH